MPYFLKNKKKIYRGVIDSNRSGIILKTYFSKNKINSENLYWCFAQNIRAISFECLKSFYFKEKEKNKFKLF